MRERALKSWCRRLARLHSHSPQQDDSKTAASLWRFGSLLAWKGSRRCTITACARTTDENLNN